MGTGKNLKATHNENAKNLIYNFFIKKINYHVKIKNRWFHKNHCFSIDIIFVFPYINAPKKS